MKSALAILSSITLFLVLMETARADRLVLVAGGGTGIDDVPATTAKLNGPFAVDFDDGGNMYVAEMTGQRLLRVDAKGQLTIVGGTGKKNNSGDGGPARLATFNAMHNLAASSDGFIYLADTWNNRVRKFDPKSGTIAAFAGTGAKGYSGDGGPALQASFTGIYSLAFNFPPTKLYLADLENRRIRVIDMQTGIVDLFAGNGKRGTPPDGADAKTAPLVDPRAVTVDRQGNVYILERSGNALRVVDPHGKVRTVAGTGKAGAGLGGGDPLKVEFNGPKHLCVDLADNVIIADTANHRIMRYAPKEQTITLLAGTGKKGSTPAGRDPLETNLDEPHGVFVHPSGALYIVDSMNNRVVRLEK
jgi:hypothetical protein